MKPTVPLEAEILRRTREAIGKLPYVVLWRNNTGMLEDKRGTKVRFGLCEGSSDLVGVVMCEANNGIVDVRVGRLFALELKQPGKKPTTKQLEFLALVNKMGGYGGWCSSVDEALAHVEKARCL